MSAETSHATPARAEDKTPPKGLGAMAGAMFLMATSAIGPGFLTQTSVFTVQMGASFAFAIMLSILVDIAIQLNVWRVLCVSGMRANTLGNTVLPGLGWVLAVFVFIGGAVFNIGNIAGSGLGINAMLGIDARIGGVIAAPLAAWLVTRLNPILLGGIVGTLIVTLNLPVVLKFLGVGASVLVAVRIAVIVVGVALAIRGWKRARENSRAAAEKEGARQSGGAVTEAAESASVSANR